MRAWLALTLASLAAAACTPMASEQPDHRRKTEALSPIIPDMPRQRIALMSSLPLVYGAGVDMAGVIAGKADPHPLHRALAAAHDLVVPDVLDARTLEAVRLAILVQPRALGPQEFVALDMFVRDGGRLLLFVDPMLEWPHGTGLADPQGPLRSSLMSPLLKHWGIELLNPGVESRRGGKSGVLLARPGQFGVLQGKSGDAQCRVDPAALVARCQVGRGRAILVADADLLDPEILRKPDEFGRAGRQFVHDLLGELGREGGT
jgi:hypothetical protein